MDRLTGEVLYARPFHHVTTSTGVDLETGRLIYNPEKDARIGRVTREICPASPGAKDWQRSAYSPETGLLYIPHNNLCQDSEPAQTSYIAGTPYIGMETRMYAGPGGHRGELTAWDVAAGREVWTIKEDFPAWSGTAVTAGDLVFYGTIDGWFKAVDARTGEQLWRFKVGSGIVGQPTTYRGPRRQAVRRHPVRRRWLGGCDRRRRARSARRHGVSGLRQCHAGSAAAHRKRRHPVCLQPALIGAGSPGTRTREQDQGG